MNAVITETLDSQIEWMEHIEVYRDIVSSNQYQLVAASLRRLRDLEQSRRVFLVWKVLDTAIVPTDGTIMLWRIFSEEADAKAECDKFEAVGQRCILAQWEITQR